MYSQDRENYFVHPQGQAIDLRGLVATYGIDTLLCQTPGPGYRSARWMTVEEIVKELLI